jgi:hypothetical protein
MAIKRNAAPSSFIKTAGEYRVKVIETKMGMSKTNKPMLTVTFQTADEKSISGYFVQGLDFHRHVMKELKLAAGLKVEDHHENLVGKEVGIAVELQEPDANGRTFAQITGYGPASEVAGFAGGEAGGAKKFDDEVPF